MTNVKQWFFDGSPHDKRFVCRWAREVLADDNAVVLDTETTALDGYVVEIAVLSVVSGEPIIDTLVNPQTPIPAQASAIHKITDAMVARAPTFTHVLRDLHHAVKDRRVLIYNAAFDIGVLRREIDNAYGPQTVGRFAEAPSVWECAMEPYAAFVGNWSDYHQSYTWPKLNGGHRAAGDCRAVIDRLRDMAASGEVVVPQ